MKKYESPSTYGDYGLNRFCWNGPRQKDVLYFLPENMNKLEFKLNKRKLSRTDSKISLTNITKAIKTSLKEIRLVQPTNRVQGKGSKMYE